MEQHKTLAVREPSPLHDRDPHAHDDKHEDDQLLPAMGDASGGAAAAASAPPGFGARHRVALLGFFGFCNV